MQQTPEQLMAMLTGMGIVLFIALAFAALVALAIGIGICWFLASCLQRIPVEHRKQEPGMVWLLLIPCFSLVWNFFVFPKIAESFQSYFESTGRTEFGDCGRALGMYCCFAWVGWLACYVLSMIPFIGRVFSLVGCLASVAGLVLLIMFLVKASSLKDQIPETPAA